MIIISRLCLLILVFAAIFVAAPKIALADNPLEDACKGQAADSTVCKQAAGQGKTDPIAGPNGIINKAANIVALVAIIGATIMILIGGFFYVTSAGNQENAKKAKDRIVSALIGIVVVALAWAIVRLVTDRILQ